MRSNSWHFFELLWGMTEKEIRARYKYTLFGFLWLVINPVLQMLVIGFIFSFFVKEPIQNYYYFLFTGLLVWNFLSLTLTKATPSIVYERSLIKKAAFPRSVIPLSILFSNFFHFIIAFGLFLIPVAFLETLSLVSFMYLLAAMSLLVVFATGIILITAAMNVRFRDVNFFVQAAIIIWFYASPVLYSISQIPSNLLWLWFLNPLTAILQLFQHAMLNLPLPDFSLLVANLLIISVLFLGGVIFFKRESHNFDDWL